MAFRRLVTAFGGVVCAIALANGAAPAQTKSGHPAGPANQPDLNAKIEALSQSLDETRLELSQSREEIKELRGMLEQVMQRMGGNAPSPAATVSSPGPANQSALVETAGQAKPAQISEDDWQILNARIDELAQDKVESNLKYRLKLSGIVLLNAFSLSGQVDNLDVPTVALPHDPASPSGAVGASLRQSIIELTGIGPRVFGADTVGDLQADFFGGLPSGYGANISGLMRLRIARLRMDWSHTSLFGGLDVPFFSPNWPTSYMSIALPAFAAAGNLWAWAPTLGFEQRVEAGSAELKAQAGLMDPPTYQAARAVRVPSAPEASRQPTYALRLSANGRDERRPIAFGISGIYSPQRYAGGASVNGWGGVADWRVPLFPHTDLSGQMFVGKGIDSFGGVPSVVPAAGDYEYYGTAAPALAKITMTGGWTQLSLKIDSKNEFNFGFGSGGRNSADFRLIQPLDPSFATLSPRNQMLFVNYVFRPRSDLLLSPEFRRLRTYPSSGAASIADQVGVAAGFLF
jgi:outer membrane murein-binding lipoprotein Lpp